MTKNRPQAVVFDLGKVLVNFDFGLARSRIAQKSSGALSNLKAISGDSPLLHRYETGQIDTEQFYREVKALLGYRGDADEFGRAFADIFSEIPEMVALSRRLREAGIPRHILSNTNPLAVDHIQATFPFFSEFDGHIYSYKVGAMKPDEAVYRETERVTGCAGDDLLFIDDREENVEAARALGWRGVVQKSPSETIAALESLFPDLRAGR